MIEVAVLRMPGPAHVGGFYLELALPTDVGDDELRVWELTYEGNIAKLGVFPSRLGGFTHDNFEGVCQGRHESVREALDCEKATLLHVLEKHGEEVHFAEPQAGDAPDAPEPLIRPSLQLSMLVDGIVMPDGHDKEGRPLIGLIRPIFDYYVEGEPPYHFGPFSVLNRWIGGEGRWGRSIGLTFSNGADLPSVGGVLDFRSTLEAEVDVIPFAGLDVNELGILRVSVWIEDEEMLSYTIRILRR